MKKVILSFALIAAFLSSQAQTSILKTNPITLAFGLFNACYEKKMGDKTSLEVSGSYFFKFGGTEGASAGGLGLGYKFYVTRKESPRGFYVMPNAGVSFGTTGVDESFNTIGFGALLGYQIVGDSGFTFDFGVGPNYVILGGTSTFENSVSGILPDARIAIGYAW